MDVIILAGGRGTRLKDITKDIPKVMVEFNKIPLLEHTFKYLEQFKVNNIILAVGYKSEYIERYFGDRYNGMNIIYSRENEALDTGGATKQAITYSNEENVIVMNGDLILNVNLEELYNTHINQDGIEATLTIKEMQNYSRFGTVISNENIVQEFKEKEYMKIGDINVGVYVINKEKFIQENTEKIFSIERKYFKKLAKSGKIYVYRYNDVFLDIGIESDYNAAKLFFKARNKI